MRRGITQFARIEQRLADNLARRYCDAVERECTGRRQGINAHRSKIARRAGGIDISKTEVAGRQRVRRVFIGRNRLVGADRFVIGAEDGKFQC